MSVFFLLLSLAILLVTCMRGLPIFIAAFVSGLVLVVTAGLNPVDLMLKTYGPGLGKYFGDFFFIFVFGAIFGKLTDISGAADSIATIIIKKLGERFIIPSLIVACAVLTFGGVSVFVALFTVYSMMISLFRKANLPRRLIPAVYFGGAGSFVMILPGSPQIQNLIPMKFLGTTAMAGLVPGLIVGAIEAVLIFTYLQWEVKRCRARGEGFTERENETVPQGRAAERKLPHPLVAILPMVVLLVSLNVFKLESALALFVGIVSAMVLYSPFIDWARISKHLGAGTMEGTTSLFNTAAIVGFGYLVQTAPAFQAAISALTTTGLNPLLASATAIGSLVFISGSGSGALSIVMPILTNIYMPIHAVDPDALHRVATMACMGTTPPFNGLVVTVLAVCGFSHKEAYGPIGVVTLAIPFLCLVLMVSLYMFVF
ncbi:MAG: GntP family permease [Telmatospirillum sp.]|nr:GntP family permease [Telmatospirillum sp.]